MGGSEVKKRVGNGIMLDLTKELWKRVTAENFCITFTIW